MERELPYPKTRGSSLWTSLTHTGQGQTSRNHGAVEIMVKPVEICPCLQGIPGPGTEPSDQVETRKPSPGVGASLLVEQTYIHMHVYQCSLGRPFS